MPKFVVSTTLEDPDWSNGKAFEEMPERRDLRLRESKVVGDGVLVLIYERAA